MIIEALLLDGRVIIGGDAVAPELPPDQLCTIALTAVGTRLVPIPVACPEVMAPAVDRLLASWVMEVRRVPYAADLAPFEVMRVSLMRPANTPVDLYPSTLPPDEIRLRADLPLGD